MADEITDEQIEEIEREAREAAIEEAAQECEQFDLAKHAAAAIRALKSQKATSTPTTEKSPAERAGTQGKGLRQEVRWRMSDWLNQIPKGMTLPRKHYLRDLREIDIDNLKCGRITNFAMLVAFNRLLPLESFEAEKLNAVRSMPIYAHMYLADELNDMLEAAKGGDLLLPWHP